MSFSNLKYDTCESKIAIKESIGPGLYQLNPPLLCNTCYQDNPQIINQRGGVSMNADVDWRFYAGPVDVETDLLNINRVATKCPSGKYEPRCPNCNVVVSGQPCGQGVANVCHNCKRKIPAGGMCNQNMVNLPDCHFPVENTRLSNPPSTLRGTGWNRFEDLYLDPQAQLFFPGEYHIPTRTVFRDNFRPCLRKVQVNSMHPEDYMGGKVAPIQSKCQRLGIADSQFATPLFLRKQQCGQ